MSYNQPKFSAIATWSANAITVATSTTVGTQPYGIFVNANNTLYVASRTNSRVLMWLEGSNNWTKTISSSLLYPYALFVTTTGDIYVDNGYINGRVDKFRSNTTNTSVLVMSVGSACFGLFVDISNSLYCSMYSLHQVVVKPLNSGTDALTVVAGTGCAGSASNMLNNPHGIFVNTNFDLYVADCINNRIQHFESEQLTGTTVAGSGATGTITLSCPTGVVLDADNYLFIVDSNNHRIIGSGPNGFRIIVGYFGPGSTLNRLNSPQSMAFDSHGNMFITDQNNNRVQKFVLSTNSCSKYSSI